MPVLALLVQVPQGLGPVLLGLVPEQVQALVALLGPEPVLAAGAGGAAGAAGAGGAGAGAAGGGVLAVRLLPLGYFPNVEFVAIIASVLRWNMISVGVQQFD